MEMGVAIEIGLSQRNREGVVSILVPLLADEYLIYTKTRNYHWNVTGRQFHDLHKFFEEQYGQLNVIVDQAAEQNRQFGGWAPGTLEEMLKYTRLKESPGKYPRAEEMIADLLGDHEAIINSLRKDLETVMETYHDAASNNFLTDLLERHQKMAWMLRATLKQA
jgi:starvation-inducible DNA-binding protein